MFDQGLQHSCGGEATTQARYFTLHMHIDDGYPIHNAFAITRNLVVENFDDEVHQVEKPLNTNYENFSNRAFREEPDNRLQGDLPPANGKELSHDDLLYSGRDLHKRSPI